MPTDPYDGAKAFLRGGHARSVRCRGFGQQVRSTLGGAVDVTPHDFRRTVATQVAHGTSLANATALLVHADEATTARH